jgi:orotate phosphoribosyltransferase
MSGTHDAASTLAPDVHDAILWLVRERGLEHREDAFQLSSGEWSHDYIDAKRAVSSGADLTLVSNALIAIAKDRDITFEAVGGMTMGADALAHGVSLLSGCDWFTVRKDPKAHGKQRSIEGCDVVGRSVMLVDDVVTTSGSIIRALDVLEEQGARVTIASCLVVRSPRALERLDARKVPFTPVLTWKDLGIAAVGEGVFK